MLLLIAIESALADSHWDNHWDPSTPEDCGGLDNFCGKGLNQDAADTPTSRAASLQLAIAWKHFSC